MSKKYGESLHNYAMEGLGGYIEEFIPTMAKEVGLTVVSVPIPLFITDRYVELLEQGHDLEKCCLVLP